MRRLSGAYGYGPFRWGDDDDDDCDDDDRDGDGDGRSDGDGEYRGHGRFKKMFGFPGRNRFVPPMRGRNGPPYVVRVHIPGTGEQISIIFKTDDHDSEKGFDAVYRVTQGSFSLYSDFQYSSLFYSLFPTFPFFLLFYIYFFPPILASHFSDLAYFGSLSLWKSTP